MSLYLESFDYYNGTGSDIGLTSRWFYASNGTNAINMVGGRFGGQAMQVRGGRIGSLHYGRAYSPLGFSSADFALNIGINTDFGLRIGQDRAPMVAIGEGTTPHIGFYAYDDGTVQLRRGGTINAQGVLLWSSEPGFYQPQTWHTLGLRGIIHDSTGELHMRWDGKDIVSLTGIDTRNGLTGVANMVWCESHDCENTYFDDIGVTDDGSTFLPEMRIQQLLPNADGAHLDLTPSTGVNHYAVVDEAQVATADYLAGSTPGQYDLLECQDITSNPQTIIGVQVVGFARKTDAGTRAIKLGIQSGGVDNDGADLYLSGTTTRFSSIYELDPNTGLAWTKAAVNAAKIKPTISI